jgi:hypothetical protein
MASLGLLTWQWWSMGVVFDVGGDDIAAVGINEGVLSSLGDVAGALLGWVVAGDEVASLGGIVTSDVATFDVGGGVQCDMAVDIGVVGDVAVVRSLCGVVATMTWQG